jgi:DNA-binding MarR family transcriptional regulator
MEDSLTELLSNKNAVSILVYLLDKQRIPKTKLQAVSTQHTINRVIPLLLEAELITVNEEFLGRKTHFVSLTPKGRQVAEQLKRAEEAAKGIPPGEEPRIIIEKNDKGEEMYVITPEYRQFAEERRKRLSALIHVNVLDDHISFKETNYESTGRDRIVTIYVKLNGNGILRLWCEVDESYDCWHVSEAWSLPEVREMYFNQVKKGNVQEKSERR